MPDRSVAAPFVPEAHAGAGLLRFRPVRQLIAAVIDLIYPPRCAACGRVDTSWCADCQRAVDQAAPLLALNRPGLLSGCAASGPHEGRLQDAVHALKYEDGRFLAPILGAKLSRCLHQLGWSVDVVVAVPLSRERIKARGYNQAGLLAQAVAQEMNLPYLAHGLVRVRETRSQVGLNHLQRQDNVSGAFAAGAGLLKGLKVLLIDDVCTTGATLNACAEAALDSGARFVYALTVTAAQSSQP